MLNNKRAQVGETITWVVATLIIVVVLGISVFATLSVSTNRTLVLDDKEKDFIATKSITSFLRFSGNAGLMEKLEEDQSKKRIRDFLSILKVKGSGSNPEGWTLQFKDEAGNTKKISHISFLTKSVGEFGFQGASNFFEMKFNLNKKELNFFAECNEDKCR